MTADTDTNIMSRKYKMAKEWYHISRLCKILGEEQVRSTETASNHTNASVYVMARDVQESQFASRLKFAPVVYA